jgi:glycosyltransferase 2 family protein
MGRTTKMMVRAIGGGLVTLVFFTLLLRSVDLNEVRNSLEKISEGWLLMAFAMLAAGYAARVIRWWIMLHALDGKIQMRACVWPLICGIAVNNVLPLRAGDVLRVMGFRHLLAAPAGRVLGTLILERLLDVATLLVILAAALAALPAEIVPRALTWMAGGSAALLLVMVFGVLFGSGLLRRIVLMVTGWRPIRQREYGPTLIASVEELIRALELLRSPARGAILMLLSSLVWILEGGMFACVSMGLRTDAGFVGPWFALATGTLATMLPSMPGYLGTFDYFAMQGLVLYGASVTSAAAFALIVHAILWGPITVMGLGYLLFHGIGSVNRGNKRLSEPRASSTR